MLAMVDDMVDRRSLENCFDTRVGSVNAVASCVGMTSTWNETVVLLVVGTVSVEQQQRDQY